MSGESKFLVQQCLNDHPHKFESYRLADHKEKVVDVLVSVTSVRVETVAITKSMRQARGRA